MILGGVYGLAPGNLQVIEEVVDKPLPVVAGEAEVALLGEEKSAGAVGSGVTGAATCAVDAVCSGGLGAGGSSVAVGSTPSQSRSRSRLVLGGLESMCQEGRSSADLMRQRRISIEAYEMVMGSFGVNTMHHADAHNAWKLAAQSAVERVNDPGLVDRERSLDSVLSAVASFRSGGGRVAAAPVAPPVITHLPRIVESSVRDSLKDGTSSRHSSFRLRNIRGEIDGEGTAPETPLKCIISPQVQQDSPVDDCLTTVNRFNGSTHCTGHRHPSGQEDDAVNNDEDNDDCRHDGRRSGSGGQRGACCSRHTSVTTPSDRMPHSMRPANSVLPDDPS